MTGNDTLLDEALHRPFRAMAVLVFLIFGATALAKAYNSIAEMKTVALTLHQIDAPRSCREPHFGGDILAPRSRSSTPSDPAAPFCGWVHTSGGVLHLPESHGVFYRSSLPTREVLFDRLTPGCTYFFSLAGRVPADAAEPYSGKHIQNASVIGPCLAQDAD